jgi:hypothetical protein
MDKQDLVDLVKVLAEMTRIIDDLEKRVRILENKEKGE